jgi:hypothetical protein
MRTYDLGARYAEHLLTGQLELDPLIIALILQPKQDAFYALAMVTDRVLRLDHNFTARKALKIAPTAQRPFKARRGHLEPIALPDLALFIEVPLDGPADPRTIVDRDAFAGLRIRPIDAQPKQWARLRAQLLQFDQLISQVVNLQLEQVLQFVSFHPTTFADPVALHRLPTNKKWGRSPTSVASHTAGTYKI